MTNGDTKISVSRDTLRAELSTLELRLVDKLAQKSDVKRLEDRIARVEIGNIDSGKEDIVKSKEIDIRMGNLEENVEKLEDDVDVLKEAYIGEVAVEKYRRWIMTGGSLIGIGVILSIVIDIIILVHYVL